MLVPFLEIPTTATTLTSAAAWKDLYGSSLGLRLPHGMGAGLLCLEVSNTHASIALSNFRVLHQAHLSGAFYPVLLSTDFSSTTLASLRFSGKDASGNHVDALVAQGAVLLEMRLDGARAVRIQAKAAADGGTVQIRGQVTGLGV